MKLVTKTKQDDTYFFPRGEFKRLLGIPDDSRITNVVVENSSAGEIIVHAVTESETRSV